MKKLIPFVAIALSGCSLTPDYDAMGNALSKLPEEDRSCEITFSDGTRVRANGDVNCDKLLSQQEAERARIQADLICSGAEVGDFRDKALCVDQVMDGSVMAAMAQNIGGEKESRRTQREQSLMFMMQEAKNASNERIAWITSLIPAFTQIGLRTYDHLDNKSNNRVWAKLADAAAAPNNVNITQSNDGGTGGEGGSGRGGDGSILLVTGRKNSTSSASGTSHSMAINQEKGVQGTNPESSFEETGGAPLFDDGDGNDAQPAFDLF